VNVYAKKKTTSQLLQKVLETTSLLSLMFFNMLIISALCYNVHSPLMLFFNEEDVVLLCVKTL